MNFEVQMGEWFTAPITCHVGGTQHGPTQHVQVMVTPSLSICFDRDVKFEEFTASQAGKEAVIKIWNPKSAVAMMVIPVGIARELETPQLIRHADDTLNIAPTISFEPQQDNEPKKRKVHAIQSASVAGSVRTHCGLEGQVEGNNAETDPRYGLHRCIIMVEDTAHPCVGTDKSDQVTCPECRGKIVAPLTMEDHTRIHAQHQAAVRDSWQHELRKALDNTPEAVNYLRLMAAVKPFALYANYMKDKWKQMDNSAYYGAAKHTDNLNVTYGDFRRAAEIFEQLEDTSGEVERRRQALATFVYECVRWAMHSAGEGFCSVGEDGKPDQDPSEFLMRYWDATGREVEFEETAEVVKALILNGRY